MQMAEQSELEFIDGGVTAPAGFTANGVLCGIKNGRTANDTALIYSERPCSAAGLFTQNRVQAESVKLSKRNISDGRAQAVIVNSGNANCCTGAQGAQAAERMARAAADALGIRAEDVVVCSTGVIGQQLPVEKIEAKLPELRAGLSKKNHTEARTAIMTTDTQYKECAVRTTIGGKAVSIGSICKGSGMIHINLGTMLSFITTDCAISARMLARALRESADGTYNCVSIDGDTSTNDTLVILANGMAGNAEITDDGEDYRTFRAALDEINTIMAMKIAADGEGATRLIECTVSGAKDVAAARGLAKEIIRSNLVKAAMFGKDANCGRILCAMGYSGFDFSPEKTSVFFSSRAGAKRLSGSDGTPRVDEAESADRTIEVIRDGVGLAFDEKKAEAILSEESVAILVHLGDGTAEGRAWGCDLTYDYVKINGDYRT